jgi:hypothetical protein
MAALRAVSSLLKASCVSDAQRLSNRVMSVLMAAWIAAVSVLVMLYWIIVYKRALVKPDVLIRFLVMLNSVLKSASEL